MDNTFVLIRINPSKFRLPNLSTLSSDRFVSVVTNADRLLVAVLEDLRPDQLAPLLRIAEQKGISVGEAVVMAMRGLLECLKNRAAV